jgi:glycosyltransferase involved in cell wall biosynthesis
VAVEVSALGRGSYDQRAFVEFALGALTADDSTSHATWSAGWLRRRDRIEGARPSRRSWLVSRSMVLGMAPRASWVAPRAQVTFLASGPALLRVARSGVITILSIADVLRVEAGGFSSRSVGAQLRRSAGEGVIVHAACQAAADAAVSVLELDRSSVVVALPGIRDARERGPESFDAIGVVAGSNRSLDVATVDSIQQRGVPAELIAANVTSSLARDTPVVASRTPTTTEILEGAVVLVESVAAGDIADAAVALATNDARRGLAIAAGRARAGDFSCQRRAPELVSVLRRALASR